MRVTAVNVLTPLKRAFDLMAGIGFRPEHVRPPWTAAAAPFAAALAGVRTLDALATGIRAQRRTAPEGSPMKHLLLLLRRIGHHLAVFGLTMYPVGATAVLVERIGRDAGDGRPEVGEAAQEDGRGKQPVAGATGCSAASPGTADGVCGPPAGHPERLCDLPATPVERDLWARLGMRV